MQPTPGFAAPVALGSLLAALYASTVSVASWLGVEPVACHPAVFAAGAWGKTLRSPAAPLAVRPT